MQMNKFLPTISFRTVLQTVLVFSMLLFAGTVFAQPPNDEPCDAIPLTVNPTCVYETYTNAGATATQGYPDPTCANYQGGDIWFTVTVPAGGAVILDCIQGEMTDADMAVYSGDCNNLTELACDDLSSPNGFMPKISLSNLTPGETIWVRIWAYGGTGNGTFGICASTPPPPPTNDEPCDAIPLTVNPTCTYETFYNEGATATQGYPAPSCGNYQGGDVWFTVTVPAEGSIVLDCQTGVVTDGAMAVYSGDCNNLTEVACDDNSSPNGLMPKITLTGLTPGETLWVRFWEYGNDNNGTFGICASIPPPPPTNDEPCDAISLPVNATCTYETHYTDGATATQGYPAPGCANYQGGDVWFTVTVPSGGAVVVDCIQGVITDGGMAIYSGDCNNLTQLACDDDSSPNGLMPKITVAGQTPGTTLWVRFWEYGNDNPGTFGICASVPPPPPINDTCTGAISLTVNPDMSCTSVTAGTTVAALPSGPGVPTPTCSPAGANDDSWFSFVATSPYHNISFLNVTGAATFLASEVYEGTCGSLVSKGCFTGNTYSISGLTNGSTYFVRVWTTTTTTDGANFNVCVGVPPPPPANDDPCGAIFMPSLDTCSYQTFTTQSATSSAGVPAPGCAYYQGGDVWFKTVVPATGGIIVNTNTGVITDGGMAIYSGDCNNLTLIECDDDDSPNGLMPMIVRTGLTPGDTIWIRFWEYGNDNPGTFNICVKAAPPAPANDDPCNAFDLYVDQGGNCNFATYSTFSASPTSGAGIPAPGCANYQGGDVWFKAVVPCSGSILISTNRIDVTDGGMALYTGTCDNMTLVTCNDDGAGNGMPAINANNLNPGDTVWVRFWTYGNNNPGAFGICAAIPPPPPPASDCSTALPFCTSAPFTVPNITGQPNTNGSGPYGCLYTIPNPTYYYLQIQNAGDIAIQVQQHNLSGSLIDVDFVLWGPFNDLAAACNGVAAANIVDCSYSAAGTEEINIANGQPGQFYLLLVTNYSNQPGTITYQQIGGTGSTSCDVVCTTNATNTGPVCAGGTFNLGSDFIENATYAWTGPNCFSSTLQNPTQVVAPTQPGTYVYTVIATDTTSSGAATCADTTKLTVVAAPNFRDTSAMICQSTSIDLNSLYNMTGITANWTIGGAAVANPSAVSQSGNYQLIGSNSFGCVDTAHVNIFVDTVKFTTAVEQVPCTQTATITVTTTQGISPFSMGIDDSELQNETNVFTVNGAGNHTVTVQDSLLCETQSQVTVTLLPPFEVDAGEPVTIIIGDATTLTSSGTSPIVSYLWSPATGLSSATISNPVASPSETTTYTLTGISQQGCEATDTVTVTVIPICIEVRNAFTPNGDGINDYWMVYRSNACLKNVSVQVFNRYGNTVYENKNYNNTWDGTYKGKPVPDGTYYAVCKFTLIDNKVVTIKKDVTVLR